MRTGLIRPFPPRDARHDITARHVDNVTSFVTGEMEYQPQTPSGLPAGMPPIVPVPAPPSAATSAVAETTVATPPRPLPNASAALPGPGESGRHHWHHSQRRMHPMVAEIQRLHPKANIHGAAEPELGEFGGFPLAKFEIAASPPRVTAQVAATNLRLAAHALFQRGLGALPAELVGGPLAALMRGGAVELHFQNGVVVRATP
jgi:hypothetical protein